MWNEFVLKWGRFSNGFSWFSHSNIAIHASKPSGRWCFHPTKAAMSDEVEAEPVVLGMAWNSAGFFHTLEADPWTGFGKCPNWISPNYWGLISNRYLKVMFKIPKKGLLRTADGFQPFRCEQKTIRILLSMRIYPLWWSFMLDITQSDEICGLKLDTPSFIHIFIHIWRTHRWPFQEPIPWRYLP